MRITKTGIVSLARPRIGWIPSALIAAGVTLALLTPATGASASSATPPSCAASQLQGGVVVGGGEAAAGSRYIPIQLSNIGSTTCTMFGLPGMVAAGFNGAPLGNAARWSHSTAAHLVTLPPGATAHTVVQISNAGAYPNCRQAQASGLRVIPPNRTQALFIPYPFPACSNTGPSAPTILTVTRPMAFGAGIPGR